MIENTPDKSRPYQPEQKGEESKGTLRQVVDNDIINVKPF